ncbi:thioester domain-containing protein [Streptomyces sp. NRRL S-87]|uniref:thioester domain-containing protein n=1 Tax=Streptomyces sp. NRRL S-87 TaxID=1463920 RepID=UPI000ABB3641|nr:thioester domain-containing protein [Streptomyces sp. NRRL S-87]
MALRPSAMAASLLAAALTGSASAGVAWADTGSAGAPVLRPTGGTTAVLAGLSTGGEAVLHTPTGVRRIPAGLYELQVDGGGTLQTYGVGIAGLSSREARFTETAWSGSALAGNKDAGRIRWVLQHSYPQLNDLAGLARRAGAGALTADTAAAGTQVAIWRFSDHVAVTAADPAAEKLADYLQKAAKRLPEPPASLTLTPGTVTGPAGGRIGPVTVHTGAQSVSVAPDQAAQAAGVRITGADGTPVTQAANGTRLYFDVPEGTPDGVGAVTVQGATRVPVGRVLTSEGAGQPQIVAGSSESAATATATGVWAPTRLAARTYADALMLPETTAGAAAPKAAGGEGEGPESAETRLAASGSSNATPVIAALAVGLVVLGAGVVFLLRQRPTDSDPHD